MHADDENPNLQIHEHRGDFDLTGATGAYAVRGENPDGKEMAGEKEEEPQMPTVVDIG